LTRDCGQDCGTPTKRWFTPLPRATLAGSRAAQAGVQMQGVSGLTAVVEDKEEIQLLVAFDARSEFEALKQTRIADATRSVHRQTLFLIGQAPANFQQQVADIHQSEQIFSRHRARTVEREVSDYLNAQQERARAQRGALVAHLRDGLYRGSVVFQGQHRALGSLGKDLKEAVSRE